MNEISRIHLVDIPIGGRGGYVWNRLHEERENICEAVPKDFGPLSDERKGLLQSRLRKVDDALDRLMSGSYGNCSKCGRKIDDSKLDIDPALALCLECWTSEHGHTPSGVDGSDVMLGSLKPFDTILLGTCHSHYRIMLIDPETGRALIEGGSCLAEPSEALVRGSALPGQDFKAGIISVGGRLELWLGERVLLTSMIKSVRVDRSLQPESVEAISTALH